MIHGQKVPIEKPRVRNRQNNREICLGSYELFQWAALVEETVWQKIMYGLPCGATRKWCSSSWMRTDWRKHGERPFR